MIDYLIVSAAATLAIFVLLLKLNIRKLLAFDVYIDVAATFFLMQLFSGSFTGLASAVIAGCLLSLLLLIIKKTKGYERLVFDENYIPSWETVPPSWTYKTFREKLRNRTQTRPLRR